MFTLLVMEFLFGFTLAFLGDQTLAVWEQEWLEVCEEVFFVDAEIPVQEEEELAFHEVDLGEGETEALVALHHSVPGPMLVLGA